MDQARNKGLNANGCRMPIMYSENYIKPNLHSSPRMLSNNSVTEFLTASLPSGYTEQTQRDINLTLHSNVYI